MSGLREMLVEHSSQARWERLTPEERVQHTLENSKIYQEVQAGKQLAENLRKANERIQHQNGQS